MLSCPVGAWGQVPFIVFFSPALLSPGRSSPSPRLARPPRCMLVNRAAGARLYDSFLKEPASDSHAHANSAPLLLSVKWPRRDRVCQICSRKSYTGHGAAAWPWRREGWLLNSVCSSLTDIFVTGLRLPPNPSLATSRTISRRISKNTEVMNQSGRAGEGGGGDRRPDCMVGGECQ